MTTSVELSEAGRRLADVLRQLNQRIVFAESCTAGLVSATLAESPGISEFHCGSAVVYRNETKARWLSVDRDILADPGPVSPLVARALADGALARTPEANIAVAITGHLGPDAPAGQDGLVFIGFAHQLSQLDPSSNTVRMFRLASDPAGRERTARQREAAWCVLDFAAEQLSVALNTE